MWTAKHEPLVIIGMNDMPISINGTQDQVARLQCRGVIMAVLNLQARAGLPGWHPFDGTHDVLLYMVLGIKKAHVLPFTLFYVVMWFGPLWKTISSSLPPLHSWLLFSPDAIVLTWCGPYWGMLTPFVSICCPERDAYLHTHKYIRIDLNTYVFGDRAYVVTHMEKNV